MSEHIEYEARTVRPYAVTGGRVRSARSDLPLEALVEAMPGAGSVRPRRPCTQRAFRSPSVNTSYSAMNWSRRP